MKTTIAAMPSTMSRATFDDAYVWTSGPFAFGRVCGYYDKHCREKLPEVITKMCQEKGYPLGPILKHVAKAGAARTLLRTKFQRQAAW